MINKIIAEIGSVHDGNLKLAFKLIKKASECGADIIKFQMHLPEHESLIDAPSPSYFKSEDRYSYFKRTSFTVREWKKIKKYCESLGKEFLCSPFSLEAVDILKKMDVKCYKVPSGELTNTPLIEKIKKTKKNVFLSTGMSNYREISNAVKILKKNKLVLLQCSSIYPCPEKNVGLNLLNDFKKKYNCRVGFSDHTLGSAASYAAAAIGAVIIEKHFTLSRKMYGSDAKHSMEPREFKEFCSTIKEIWRIKKHKVNKNDLSKFKNMKYIFEKSIYAKKNLIKGKIIKFSDLSFKKPSNFLRADNYKALIGKKLKSNIKKDDPINVQNIK
jgi:N,N'-diacetyllegionaminate synthase